jgi:hypothetical protein
VTAPHDHGGHRSSPVCSEKGSFFPNFRPESFTKPDGAHLGENDIMGFDLGIGENMDTETAEINPTGRVY